MTEQELLEQAIAHIETQRAILGDDAVLVAVRTMREKLASLQATASTPTSERKVVTVMFADISGFTEISEKMDPELVRDTMNACFSCLVPVVTRYGGVIDKFIGDEIMALFGAPIAHENDPERAIRVALEMMDSLANFNLERNIDLGLHFGINTGLVLAGMVGVGERQSYSVMGDAVNLASRLKDAAKRGQILTGADTSRETAALVDFETLEPISVKGKSEPVAAYRVIGLKSNPERVRGLERQGIQSVLVGRDPELTTLKACVANLAATKQGGLVAVLGEAGLGKSRLLAETRSSFQPDQILWLEGHTLSFSQTISYWPFQQILRSWASITEEDDEESAWRKLETAVKSLFDEAETAEILPYLASLLALQIYGEHAERVKYLDGEALGKQIFLTARRFLERLAQSRPTVLAFEDLHWADQSSIHLLEHLLPLVERIPLLIIGLSRPDSTTPAMRIYETLAETYPKRYTEIRLHPLTYENSTKLAHNLLAIDGLPLNVREMMVTKADGNPFFLEEIIRTLIDAKAVARDPATGQWLATKQIETLSIPNTIQGVLMARVDRLDEEVKRVLQMAAVVGRSFFYRVLKSVADAEKSLDQHLTELQSMELISEKQITPELEYIFKHALAQETTYESILLQKRRELHLRVGQAVERLFADRLEEFYGLLAYHYAKAEEWEKAQLYLVKAGDQAGRMAADSEALTYYQQATKAYGRAFGTQSDALSNAGLERKVAEVFFRRGQHAEAVEHAERALNFLGHPFPKSRGAIRVALLKEVLQQLGNRFLPGLFLRKRSSETTPALNEQFLCYELIGLVEVLRNLEPFLLTAIRMLNLAEQNGIVYSTAVGAAAIGLMLDLVSMPRLAIFYLNWAVSLADESAHPKAISTAYYCMACHGYVTGDLRKSLADALRAAEAPRKIGDLRAWGLATWIAATPMTYLGQFAESVAHAENMIALGEDGADINVSCWGLTALGEVQRRLGQFESAIASLEKAREMAHAIPDYRAYTISTAELGRCYLRTGKLNLALTVLEEGQRIKLAHGVRGTAVARLVNALAEAYLWQAEAAPNDDALKAKALQACQAAIKHNQGWQIALPDSLRLQGKLEWLLEKPDAARTCWLESLTLAEQIGARYDAGLTHFEIGKRLREASHAQKAEAIFSELGAEWDLAQVRQQIPQS